MVTKGEDYRQLLSHALTASSKPAKETDIQGGQLLTWTPLSLASLAASASSLALKSLSLASSSCCVAPDLVVFERPNPLAVSCESREKVESFAWEVNGFCG
jgi:hypothetical protein